MNAPENIVIILHLFSAHIASMRPGHECPGKPEGPALDEHPIPYASMRPGHECPGKRRDALPSVAFSSSFNEAGA